jgi:hypothetical protein
MTGYLRGVRQTYYNGRLHVITRSYYRGVEPGRFTFSFASKHEGVWERRSDMEWGRAW